MILVIHLVTDCRKIFSKKRKLVSRNNDLVTPLSGNNELMTSLTRYYDLPTFVSSRKSSGDPLSDRSAENILGERKVGKS